MILSEILPPKEPGKIGAYLQSARHLAMSYRAIGPRVTRHVQRTYQVVWAKEENAAT
jgi:hypothetical protein